MSINYIYIKIYNLEIIFNLYEILIKFLSHRISIIKLNANYHSIINNRMVILFRIISVIL